MGCVQGLCACCCLEHGNGGALGLVQGAVLWGRGARQLCGQAAQTRGQHSTAQHGVQVSVNTAGMVREASSSDKRGEPQAHTNTLRVQISMWGMVKQHGQEHIACTRSRTACAVGATESQSLQQLQNTSGMELLQALPVGRPSQHMRQFQTTGLFAITAHASLPDNP